MRSRRLLSVLFVAPVLALSACGGSDESAGIKPIESAEPSASATPSATPTAPAETPLPTTTAEAAKLAVSVLGSSVADTADEKAAVAAWMTYWDAASKTFSDLEPAAGLDSARGEPLANVLNYLNELKAKNHRSVGWTRDHVLTIEVNGGAALIRDCAENFSFEVDSAGKPVQDVSPFFDISGSLTKDGDRWIVTVAKTTKVQEDCRQ